MINANPISMFSPGKIWVDAVLFALKVRPSCLREDWKIDQEFDHKEPLLEIWSSRLFVLSLTSTWRLMLVITCNAHSLYLWICYGIVQSRHDCIVCNNLVISGIKMCRCITIFWTWFNWFSWRVFQLKISKCIFSSWPWGLFWSKIMIDYEPVSWCLA